MSERLTRDEALILLVEECGEVIQAATKCLRFGYDSQHKLEYGINSEVLAREAGDLLAVLDYLNLDADIVALHRSIKIAKAERAKAQFGPSAAAKRTPQECKGT